METKQSPIVVFSDLNESLLDRDYTFAGAETMIERLRKGQIPLVICSSKTKAEILYIRSMIGNDEPFIAENGGALYIPEGYFDFPIENGTKRGSYIEVTFGVEHDFLKAALKEIAETEQVEVRCYTDMRYEDLRNITGIPEVLYRCSLERFYDEPFLLPGGSEDFHKLYQRAQKLKLTIYKGERFYHIMGKSDKTHAVSYLIELYILKMGNVATVGIGDGLNDLPMMEATGVPIFLGNLWHLVKDRPQYKKAVHVGSTGSRAWAQGLEKVLASLG